MQNLDKNGVVELNGQATVTLDTRELKPGFGVEIMNVDLASADEETLKAIIDTFHRNGVMLIRNQHLTPDELSAFTASFGELESNILKQFTVPDHPEIYILSNKVVDGKPIGAHFDGVTWHTDATYLERPAMTTLLYGIEVPPEEGDTLIADAVGAFNALPMETKTKIDGLQVLHSYRYFTETREYGRRQLTEQEKLDTPDVVHPLIRKHPVDGRKALFLSTGAMQRVLGMPDEEGRALIKKLADFVTQDRFIYRHKWQVGDILMWDDRCTVHRATFYDDKKYTRVMYRLWVKGDRPF